jgi:hypothetical protein
MNNTGTSSHLFIKSDNGAQLASLLWLDSMAGRARLIVAGLIAVSSSFVVVVFLSSVSGANPVPQNVLLSQVVCSAPTSCAAVGSYTDTSGATEGMFLNKVGSNWSATEAPFPTSSTVQAIPRSIACPTSNWCTAVGVSSDNAGDYLASWVWANGVWTVTRQQGQQGESWLDNLLDDAPHKLACSAPYKCVLAMASSEILHDPGGQWSFVSDVDHYPPTKQIQDFDTVACSRRSCTAIGTGVVQESKTVEVVLSNASGQWSATFVKMPSHPQHNESLSCVYADRCGAVSLDSSGSSGPILGEIRGEWSTSMLPVPADAVAGAYVTEMSCGPNLCTMVGSYGSSSISGDPPVILDNVNGNWRALGDQSIPGVTATSDTVLDATSCDGTDVCTMAGLSVDANDPTNPVVPVVVTDDGGVLSTSTLPLPPDVVPNTQVGNFEGYLQAIACSGTGSCSAVGLYHSNGPGLHGLIEEEVAGQWQVITPPLPTDAAA